MPRVLLISVALSLAGCGYTLSHRLQETFTRHGIFVPVFTNRTEETGAELIFTNALIRELRSRGEVVVSDRKPGAMELHGTLTSITYSPTAFTAFGFGGLADFRRLPSEIGVSVGITLTLLDPATGKAAWSNHFSGFRRVSAPIDRTYDYQAPSSLGLFTQSLIESQYASIAGDIMRDVYDNMVELFN